MRFLPKGGMWKNTEDEILKASVMKYGLNQWSRISSLLTRKTAKQCKARWYEWLDPAIKKTEWDKDEEEKLLHLAKIMPTQWRTIAPIIGRTASQCLEHYEKLISQHEGAGEGDVKQLRAGEIDPTPETRPARPDPIDMDEDELEMLQEARARLANTKGKKAKRKARERMLREARRLASIQKRNELKAAGINMREYKSRKDKSMDYNAEIPFHIRQPIGFHDTFEEDRFALENPKTIDFKRLTSEKFEGNPEDAEARERKKDAKRQQLYKEAFLPDVVKAATRSQNFVSRRPTLKLPAPQVSNSELENLATILSNTNESGLLTAQSAQTPLPSRTPLTADIRRRDIEDNIALSSATNPLLGGESVALHDPHFQRKGIELEHAKDFAASTPNAMVLAMLQHSGITPSDAQTPFATTPLHKASTPFRDALKINPPFSGAVSGAQTPSETRKKQREADKKRLKTLKKRLGALPRPAAQNSIVLPDEFALGPAEKGGKEREAAGKSRKRAADRDDLASAALEAVKGGERASRRRRATAARRAEASALPLPGGLSAAAARAAAKGRRRRLLLSGASEGEFAAAAEAVGAALEEILKAAGEGAEIVFAEEEIQFVEKARSLIDAELQSTAKKSLPPLSAAIDAAEKDVLFLPSKKLFGFLSSASLAEKQHALRQELQLLQTRFSARAAAARKAAEKERVLLEGYRRRAEASVARIGEGAGALGSKRRELATFELIRRRERVSAPLRVERARKLVSEEEDKELALQKRYKRLFSRYKDVMKMD